MFSIRRAALFDSCESCCRKSLLLLFGIFVTLRVSRGGGFVFERIFRLVLIQICI